MKNNSLFLVGFIFLNIFCKEEKKTQSEINTIQVQTHKDTCADLNKFVNYYAEDDRFRTIDFLEGKDTFRTVSDTTSNNYNIYIQRKKHINCWETIEKLEAWQAGIRIEDCNDDGYVDIINIWRYWANVSLYMPEDKTFSNQIEFGSPTFHSLPNNFKHHYISFGDNPVDAESELFRFENYDKIVYAKLRFHYKRDDCPDGYDCNYDYKVERIELFEVKNADEIKIKEWNPEILLEFIKNNGTNDYFDKFLFIETYWKENWQIHVKNKN